MKRTALGWAAFLEADSGLYGENKAHLAELLRAMVREQQAADAIIMQRPGASERRWGEAVDERRKAEGRKR